MEKDRESKIGIGGLLRRLLPFVLPYRWLLVVTLVLTFAGALMAQVNAIVLDRTVDAVNALIGVKLPAGHHTVTMKYTPPGFKTGILTLIIGIALLVMLYKKDCVACIA